MNHASQHSWDPLTWINLSTWIWSGPTIQDKLIVCVQCNTEMTSQASRKKPCRFALVSWNAHSGWSKLPYKSDSPGMTMHWGVQASYFEKEMANQTRHPTCKWRSIHLTPTLATIWLKTYVRPRSNNCPAESVNSQNHEE